MLLERLNPEDLSQGQRALAEYFVRNAQRIPYLSIDEIAADAGTSTATVSRFAKLVGYRSLKELKGELRETLEATPQGKMSERLDRLGEGDLVSGIIGTEMAHLAETMDLLDRGAFDRAVAALGAAKTVCLYGNGAAAAPAALLAFRLNRYGTHVHTLGRNRSTMAEGLVHVGPSTAVVAFAFLKERPQLARAFDLAREAGSATILITDMRVSATAEQADIVLAIERGSPEEFHSMVAPVAIVDALVIALARAYRDTTNAALDRLQEVKSRLRGP